MKTKKLKKLYSILVLAALWMTSFPLNGAEVETGSSQGPPAFQLQNPQGVCINNFGSGADWEKIEKDGIAVQYGNTPWGIMAGNECNAEIVSGYGIFGCGFREYGSTWMQYCNGKDCKDGECVASPPQLMRPSNPEGR